MALMQTVRMDFSASQYEKAYQTYAKKVGETDAVDELLNLGLLAFESGDYTTSFRLLSDAKRLAEERLTKSISREAAWLAVSDIVSAYQGTVFDKAMIHYYRSLGFLAQKNLESATVEGRAIAQYLEVNARESKRTYKDDAFLQWFSGSLYDAFGQANDAWISYKRAREIYGADYYGVREPSFMCPVTLSAVRKVGYSESETELKNECPAAAESLKSNWGRVIVLCEVGQSPPIHEENIMLPIYKNDPHDFKDDDERGRFAHDVAMRRGHNYHEQSDVKLDYFLRVALPYYSADYVGSGVSQVLIKDTTGREIPAEPAQNIGAILRQDLSDREPAILVRAVTRALIKYAATKVAENVGDKKSESVGQHFRRSGEYRRCRHRGRRHAFVGNSSRPHLCRRFSASARHAFAPRRLSKMIWRRAPPPRFRSRRRSNPATSFFSAPGACANFLSPCSRGDKGGFFFSRARVPV